MNFEQVTMFDNGLTPGEGRRVGRLLADEAIARADEHAEPDWRDVAFAAVKRLAARHVRFTPDDVWAEMPDDAPTTHEGRAMGAVMRRAARAHLIAPTGEWVPSIRPEHHAGPKRVWRGLEWGEG